jgi:hypothetical protein
MNSIHSMLPHLNLYKIVTVIFILVLAEKSTAQDAFSSIDQRQDTPRFDVRTRSKLEERPVLLSDFHQPNGEFNKHTGIDRTKSMVRMLEKYPELRSTALKEYFRLMLLMKTDLNFSQRLYLNYKRTSTLENDLRMKMRRYGVPCDPLRPTAYQIGYTVYIGDIISWPARIWR